MSKKVSLNNLDFTEIVGGINYKVRLKCDEI